jgi:YD repeat-containing protein
MIILVLNSLCLFSQGKKDIRNNKIESRTIKKTVFKDSGNVTYVDSFKKYDKNGKTILEINYNKEGLVTGKNSYTYDSFGNLTEEKEYDKKSKETIIIEYLYDSNGNCIEEITKDSGGNVVERVEYSYDNNNLKQTATEYKNDETVKWKKEYIYKTR